MGNRASSEAGELPAAPETPAENPPAPSRRRSADDEIDEPLTAEQLSYWQMAKQGYNELVNAIVRPPRAEYDDEHLGPDLFTFCGKQFMRADFPVQNPRGMTLRCSFWEPVERPTGTHALPCVIYMHGNSSARPECLPQLGLILGMGCSCLAFDFAGSGRSDGDHVSLGVYERDDLAAVIAWLRASNRVSGIALWGRSMGAATALMHGSRDPSIAAMVLDSPFSDLQDIADDMLQRGRDQGVRIPGFVVAIALRMLRNTVQKTAGFSIRECAPSQYISECFIPALFCAGRNDDFITPEHSQRLHAAYPGDKNLILVDGDHNSPRPRFMFDSVGIFLGQCLQLDPSWALDGYERYCNIPPWVSADAGFGGYSEGVYDRLGLDPEDVELLYTGGLSEERQAEIQANLLHMFGQEARGEEQAAHRASMPAGEGTVATTLEDLQASSARQLRSMTRALRVDTRHCIEKGDYIDALLGSGRVVILEEPPAFPPAPGEDENGGESESSGESAAARATANGQ